MKTILVQVSRWLMVAVVFTQWGYSQPKPDYELKEVVVTANRVPTSFSEVTRNVSIIRRDEIEASHIQSVQDLLEYALGVDVKQRGPLGIQADVSIRGGTFEQTLILVDGVKMSDPQTGHHNMNLPLTVDDIERIEVLQGHGSRLYGPNALGGVINIITRKSTEKRAVLRAITGEYGLSEQRVSLSYPIGVVRNTLSVAKKKSDGYRANTDFKMSTLSYGFSVPVRSKLVDFSLRFIDKAFGANGFYSSLFPNQWEQTKTTLMTARTAWSNRRFSFSPRFYWRRNNDYFILDKERPEWYQNTHVTDSYGFEFQSLLTTRLGSTALGGEIGNEGIESTNLGNHVRTKGGLFIEQQFDRNRILKVVLGASAYYYSDWGWKIWPGMDIGVRLTEKMRVYGSVGQSFRVPTYTELYYRSPANLGNPNLKPEEAWTYEAGLIRTGEMFQGDLSLFRREGTQLIDWVRTNDTLAWEAHNIATVNTNGASIRMGFNPRGMIKRFPVSLIRVSYAYLDSDKRTGGIESKYVLTQLRHQFILEFEYLFFPRLKQNWKFRYEERSGYKGHYLVDTRVVWTYKNSEAFLGVTNLFDTIYSEVGSVPLPGRWIVAGLSFNLFPVNR